LLVCLDAITVIHLPDGPTAHFKLTSVKLNSEIRGHGRPDDYKPELILNNFNTRLGHTVGRMLAALFPQVPEFQGRQVATFHNQRDFIFFRRHRYVLYLVFKSLPILDLGWSSEWLRRNDDIKWALICFSLSLTDTSSGMGSGVICKSWDLGLH
jgi:hypothetical protein